MRTLRFLVAGAVALSLLWACNDKEETEPTPEPTPGPDTEYDEAYYAENATISSSDAHFTATEQGGEIAYKVEGGEVVVNVDCGVEWTAEVAYSDAEGWLDAAVNCDAGTLTLTAEQNTVEAEKTATVTVMTAESGIEFATISVAQNAYGACEIKVETNEWKVPASGDGLTTEIAVEANADWEITNTADWLTAEKTDAGVKFTASENQTTEERTAEVVLTCTDGISTDSETITVTQAGHDVCTLTVETNEWNAPAVGTLTTEIAVEANADWEITNAADWLTAEKTDTGVKLTASENEETEERTAEVVLTCTDGISTASETITVTQDGKAYITIDEENQELTFVAEGGSETVKVESNFDVESSASVDWLTVSVADGVLTVTASANETEEEREGTVTLTAGDGAENVAEATISVTQACPEAEAVPLILGYTMTSDNQEAMLPLNGTVDCTVDWGDGSTPETVTTTLPTHTYASAGDYEIQVTGTVTEIASYVSGNKTSISNYLTSVKQWGNTGLTNMAYAFRNCKLLKTLPEETGDAFANVTSFSYAFYTCSVLGGVPADLFSNCSKVTDMSYLFYSCEALTSIPDGLFDGCTAVTTFACAFQNCKVMGAIPKGLFDYCTEVESFATTFSGCEAVTTIPEGLFDNCPKVTTFASTFTSALALTAIPNGLFDKCPLVTTFASTFYKSAVTAIPNGLFNNCPLVTTFDSAFYSTAITAIPGGLFDNCPEVTNFASTFRSCTALTTIPDGLFDKNTKVESFNNVFRESPITAIPEGLFDYCTNGSKLTFQYSFYKCESLQAIPEGLFDKVKGVMTDCSYLFYGCTLLTTVPNSLFAGCEKVTTFASTFYQCENLETIPGDLFKGCSAVTTFASVFRYCSKLKTIPAGMFEGCTAAKTLTYVFSDCTVVNWDEYGYEKGLFSETASTSFAYCFWNCTGLTGDIPENLFEDCTDVTTYSYTFAGCTGLTGIPAGLFDDSTKVNTFGYTFQNDSKLEGESPYTIINVDGGNVKVHLYERNDHTDIFTKVNTTTQCFRGCTGLSDYDDIPSSWN